MSLFKVESQPTMTLLATQMQDKFRGNFRRNIFPQDEAHDLAVELIDSAHKHSNRYPQLGSLAWSCVDQDNAGATRGRCVGA